LAVATSADVIDWTLGRRDPLAEVVAGTSDFAEAPDPYAELAVDAAGLLLGMRCDQRAFAGVYGDLAPPVVELDRCPGRGQGRRGRTAHQSQTRHHHAPVRHGGGRRISRGCVHRQGPMRPTQDLAMAVFHGRSWVFGAG